MRVEKLWKREEFYLINASRIKKVANNSYYRKGVISPEIKRDIDLVRYVVNLSLNRLVKLFVIVIKLITRCVIIFG